MQTSLQAAGKHAHRYVRKLVHQSFYTPARSFQLTTNFVCARTVANASLQRFASLQRIQV